MTFRVLMFALAIALSLQQDLRANTSEKLNCSYLVRRMSKGESTAKADKLFEQSFSDNSLYEAGECAKNIWNLLRQLKKSGVDISSARVHYFSSQSGFQVNSPRRPYYSWGYHAVLELHGKIYDFDFTTQPRVLSTKEYIKENIIPISDKNDPGHLEKFLNYQASLTLPATGFLRNFPSGRTIPAKNETFQKWLRRFSWITLKEFYEGINE